jgi:hypothetical protein
VEVWLTCYSPFWLFQDWKIGGRLDKKLSVAELFDEHVEVWLKQLRSLLWIKCEEAMGVAMEPEIHDFPAGVGALYAEIAKTLCGGGNGGNGGVGGSYDRVLRRWSHKYLVPMEAAICDVESKVLNRLLEECTLKSKPAMSVARVLAAKDKAKDAFTENWSTVKKWSSGFGISKPKLLTGQGERNVLGVRVEGRGEQTTSEQSAEDLLLPKRWRVVLVTLRKMLDLRAQTESTLAAFEAASASSSGRDDTTTAGNGSDGGGTGGGGTGGGGSGDDTPFGTRLSANTGDLRRHYMRHIKFVVENIHKEVRCAYEWFAKLFKNQTRGSEHRCRLV